MDYVTYWSVLDTPSKTIQPASVSLSIALITGLLWLLTKKYKKDSGDGDRTIILWATGVLSILGAALFMTLTFIYPDKSNQRFLEMLNAPTTPKVEGRISNFERRFRRSKYGGETIETFKVDSVQFGYGDALLGKFNSFAETHNDVIFNGQKVRITYASGSPYCNLCKSILKIEIAR